MPKKAVLFFAIFTLAACIVTYRLGSAPVAQAKPRPVPEVSSTLPAAPATWSLTGSSTYKSGAVITQPAGGTGVQHVVTCLAFSMSNDSAGKVFSTAILRNGASQTSPALWQYNFAIEAGASVVHSVCDLSIVGSADTALTFETSAYGPAVGSYVNLVGYDAQAQ